MGEKIKICHVASIDFTLKFMLFNQLKFLQSEGYEVWAVCSPGKWVKEIEKAGIRVKTIKIKRKISPFSDLILFFRLFFFFRKERFQIVHTHTLKPEIYGQIAASLAGVPIIINTIHGLIFSEKSMSYGHKFFALLERIASRHSDVVFTVSWAVIRLALREKICRPDLLKYLGRDIDLERFDPQRFSPEFISAKEKKLNISENKKVIGIVARLVEEKGFLELFSAFRQVLEMFPDAVLLVIGPEEPEKKDSISQRAARVYGLKERVVFLGERIDVDEIYPLMDVFVLPTHREGVGAAILEASAMEVPVVVSDVGGCPEAVEDGKTGILVPIKNVEKLRSAIAYLLANPQKAKEMGKAGRQKIIKEFRQEIIFERLKKEYQLLLNKKISSTK